MQSKVTMRYDFTPVQMAVITKRRDKCWQGCGEKSSCALLVKIGTATLENNMIQDMYTMQVSIKAWMDEENVAYIHNGILFSHKKKGSSAIYNTMDISWRHYAKWNKSDRRKDSVWSHLYVET